MIWDAPSVESAICTVFGDERSIRRRRSLGGGCINSVLQVELDDGTELLVKENSRRYEGMFVGEARGLMALRCQEGPRVPMPFACGETADAQFIVMEFIREGRRAGDFWSVFGRRLAALHQAVRSKDCGFDSDNHIGSTEQPNAPCRSWLEFFTQRRLEFQIALAERTGAASPQLVGGVRRLIERLPELLIEPDMPSILHGDLWGGNHMADEDGRPVIYDPATYYGHREADLAMTELFGRFDARFYDAYNEHYPTDAGYAERRDVYNLYHVLNHLNIFGGSYAGSAAHIVSRYV